MRAAASTSLATALLPMKWILSTPGWRTRASPASGPPGTMLTTPGGKPASSSSWPTRRGLKGAGREGLSTTVLPAASAGASVMPSEGTGPFQGMMMPDHPVGLDEGVVEGGLPARWR